MSMPKLLDVDLWGKYANMYVTYEVAPINDAAIITIHGRLQDENDTTAQQHLFSLPLGQIHPN